MTPSAPTHASPSDDREIVDAELLRHIAHGDRDAFAKLYDRFAAPLYGLALRIVREPADAQDIVHDLFVTLWEKASGFAPVRVTTFSWAVTLVRRRATERVRLHRQRADRPSAGASPDLSFASDPTSGVNTAAQTPEARAARAALATLPAEQQRALELAFFGALTRDEIAQALREPPDAVRAHLRRALLKLRDTVAQPPAIDERHEELAALYVLDLLDGPERAPFESALARDPALQSLLRELRSTSATLAHSVSTPPPHVLKARVLASAAERAAAAERASHVTRPALFSRHTLLPWTLAAGFAIAAAYTGERYFSFRTEAARSRQQYALADVALQSARQQLEAERIVTRRQLQELDQQLSQANAQLAQTRTQLDATNAQLANTNSQSTGRARQLSEFQQQLADARAQTASLRSQVVEREREVARLNQRIDALTHASSDLSRQLDLAQTRVAQLTEQVKQQRAVSDFKISVLTSLAKDQPQALAIAVWDPGKKEGILKVEKLAALAPNQDYQLWIVDPQRKDPVDAGVFAVDPKTGQARVSFKPRQPLTTASAFAITRERKGGVPKSENAPLLLGK